MTIQAIPEWTACRQIDESLSTFSLDQVSEKNSYALVYDLSNQDLILNYFRVQKLVSSGVVEGLNNKVKVTMRKLSGFRTYHVLELALDHSLGNLPEPKSTHDFF
jgi:transposase